MQLIFVRSLISLELEKFLHWIFALDFCIGQKGLSLRRMAMIDCLSHDSVHRQVGRADRFIDFRSIDL